MTPVIAHPKAWSAMPPNWWASLPNVTLVHAENGFGKTLLLNAMASRIMVGDWRRSRVIGCTERLKIKPSTAFITSIVKQSGEANSHLFARHFSASTGLQFSRFLTCGRV